MSLVIETDNRHSGESQNPVLFLDPGIRRDDQNRGVKVYLRNNRWLLPLSSNYGLRRICTSYGILSH